MESISIELSAKRLQLLAVDTLLEHARAGTSSEDSCVRLLQRIADMGTRLEFDASAVRQQELNEVQAAVLCHSMQA